jgi:hypothetical protein
MARFDTGWRLRALVLQRQRDHVEDVDSASSSLAERTYAATHGCGPALVRQAVRLDTEWRLRWPLGESWQTRPALDRETSAFESQTASSRPSDRRPRVLGMDTSPGSAPGKGSRDDTAIPSPPRQVCSARTGAPSGRKTSTGHADVAQQVARQLAMLKAAGSTPVVCSQAVLAQRKRHRVQGAGDRGSNPRDGTHGR